MNLLDVVILLLLFIQATRWAQYGFSRRFFSLAGFWIGIAIGALATPYAMRIADDPLVKFTIALALVFIFAAIVGALGRIAGDKISHLLNKVHLERVDKLAGSIFSIVATLAIVWFIASIFSGAPLQGLNRQIRGSAIIQELNRVLPPPPEVFSRISGLINPRGFPQIFIGPEPQPIGPVDPPSSEEVAAALDAAGTSVVRLESVGCGGIVYGSGFVVSPNIIVTNAHVVAGIDQPSVVDQNGRHRAEVIYFDAALDMAVLRSANLAGEPLPISNTAQSRGTVGTALGYPGGGPLKAEPASILRSITARGLDIYGNRIVERQVYMLQANVENGNSGGPVVLADGTVIGMIFARSDADDNIGYAVAARELIPRIDQALANNQPIETGACVN